MALRNIILMVRNPATTATFLMESIGLKMYTESPTMIELRAESSSMSVPIILKAADMNVSFLSTGYSPIGKCS